MHLIRPITLLALCALIGCASPERRIKQNPELFATFSPDVQEHIRAGTVQLGFTRDAVFLALGKADRNYSRQTADKRVEVWSYEAIEYQNERQQERHTFRYRDHKGRSRTARDTIWVTVQHEVHYEKYRVEFTDGVVTALEETTR